MNKNLAVTEAELHAWVDGQLPAVRQREIEAYLGVRPEELRRLESYRAQKRELRALFDSVLDEALPQRVALPARPRSPWYLQRLAAGLAIAVISGATGWGLRGYRPGAGNDGARMPAVEPAPSTLIRVPASSFAQRAAVAHADYSPDV
ncbi:MAG: anti-sigma factor, partial [Microbacteriaceae bacterium]|nr:anti-sigma factor [Burkholderiaceae bacterium]